MTKKPFREHHLLQLLDQYSGRRTLPIDCCIADYFRANKALGSKDRGAIAEAAYGMLRWKGLLEYLSPHHKGDWEVLYNQYNNVNIGEKLNDPSIPLHIRFSCPYMLFDLLVQSYGKERACELTLNSNEQAPATVRVNTLKITREQLLKRWAGEFDVSPCKISPNGIVFNTKVNFFSIKEFKEGFFEVQDEGSQLLAALIEAKPGDQIMDYCAGSGGKSLAIAPPLQGKGQLFLHDIRLHALQEARGRLKRAGIQNAQVIPDQSPALKGLKKKIDWVLVDAPCSGTGTLRRNPDMKWRFDEETIPKLVGQQRMIFEKALSYLKPGGYIVYATCSLLKQENQEQVAHFEKTYGLQTVRPIFQSWPAPGGMDGFFGAVLQKI